MIKLIIQTYSSYITLLSLEVWSSQAVRAPMQIDVSDKGLLLHKGSR